jgi:hypothetical protein
VSLQVRNDFWKKHMSDSLITKKFLDDEVALRAHAEATIQYFSGIPGTPSLIAIGTMPFYSNTTDITQGVPLTTAISQLAANKNSVISAAGISNVKNIYGAGVTALDANSILITAGTRSTMEYGYSITESFSTFSFIAASFTYLSGVTLNKDYVYVV